MYVFVGVLIVGWGTRLGSPRGFAGLVLWGVVGGLLLFFLAVFAVATCTRGMAVAKAMMSASGLPLVNIGIIVGNASANAAASLSNGFALAKRGKRALIFSCVKVALRRVICGKGPLRIVVGSSSGTLRRIIVVNCRAIGGSSLANTMTMISAGRVGGDSTKALIDRVRKLTANMGIHDDNETNRSTSVRVHNINSLDGGTPL